MNFVGWCGANHCCARIESDRATCIYDYCARVGDIVRYRMLEYTCASLRCRSNLVTELGYRSKVLCTWAFGRHDLFTEPWYPAKPPFLTL